MLNVLGLFSGVGGIELGLQRAGMNIVGHVERDPYCQKILHRHWRDVPLHSDVETAGAWWLSQPRPIVDVVCGGFPCQPFSTAGKGAGVDDDRWMWPQTFEVVRAVRPKYVLLENVANLVRHTGAFGRVLGDLHSLGFDAEWATLSAGNFGAPQNRRRVYVLAYPASCDGEARSGLEPGDQRGAPIAARGLLGMDLSERGRAEGAWLECEPRVDRLAHGVPDQLDRLRCAGNAVVPAASEHIGSLIVEHERYRAACV